MSDFDSNDVPNGFRQIPGFPKYCISEDGTILSICRNGAGSNRPWCDARPMRHTKIKGYPRVELSSLHGPQQRAVHSLVLETYVGPCPEGQQCRHLDGDRANCHLSNLTWGTPTENNQDRIRHGTIMRGVGHYRAKLKEDDVRNIRKRRAEGELHRVLACEFHVSIGTISNIAQRVTWKHIK